MSDRVIFWAGVAASLIFALLLEPVALYFGAWGLLGTAYGDYGAVIFGAFLIPAPLITALLCIGTAWWKRRRNTEGVLLFAWLTIPILGAGLALLLLLVTVGA